MNAQDIGALVACVVVVVSAIAWTIRLEGRINMVDQRVVQLERMAESHMQTSQTIAVVRNDIEHMKGDMSSVKDLLIALVPPSQRIKRSHSTLSD